jgi:hypothetical protein
LTLPADDRVTFEKNLSGILTGQPKRGAVLISHGAGGDMMTPLLVQTAQGLNENGFLTLRWNFGYVEAGRAPSAGGKKELPEMVAAVDFLTERAGKAPLILLGKSFGGRLSTHIAAERADIAALVLYGLPVRGIGKNPKPRDWSHLAKIKADVLFITGDKDKLCPLAELAAAQSHLSKPFQSEVVPGDHSYKPRGEAAALQICLSWILARFC